MLKIDMQRSIKFGFGFEEKERRRFWEFKEEGRERVRETEMMNV